MNEKETTGQGNPFTSQRSTALVGINMIFFLFKKYWFLAEVMALIQELDGEIPRCVLDHIYCGLKHQLGPR